MGSVSPAVKLFKRLLKLSMNTNSVRERPSDARRAARTHRRGYLPLFHRVAGINALLLIVAVVVTVLVLAPGRLSSFAVDSEVAVLLAALVLVVVLNIYLLRRVVGPLQALTALARRVDLANPGARMPDAAPNSEAGELALTFNEMLARLEAERRDATGRVLAGQEAERLRIAQELHDQVGQELTAVLLGLSRVEARVLPELRDDVLEVQDAVRASLEDVRRIAIELRPEALDDLGLASALTVLCNRFADRAGLHVAQHIKHDLPELAPEAELVVYRVAQEALTNVARHSGSDHAELSLNSQDGRLVLTVCDRGHGLPADPNPGAGLRGMRERATLIDAKLEVRNNPSEAGCEVRLDVPLDATR
jgi:two-component system sensor histidine kinase UhpB